MESKTVAEVAHHVVAVCPETDRDGGTTKCKDPDWHFAVVKCLVCRPDLVNSGERTDSVEHIVSAVTEGSDGSCHDLKERVEMFSLVVVVRDVLVVFGEILGQERSGETLGLDADASLLLDDISVHSSEEVVLCSGHESCRSLPRVLSRRESCFLFHAEGRHSGFWYLPTAGV